MTVPFSDAVARSVPVELIASAAMGALCAAITFATVRVRVWKRRTSPELGVCDVEGVGVEVEGADGDGSGEG